MPIRLLQILIWTAVCVAGVYVGFTLVNYHAVPFFSSQLLLEKLVFTAGFAAIVGGTVVIAGKDLWH